MYVPFSFIRSIEYSLEFDTSVWVTVLLFTIVSVCGCITSEPFPVSSSLDISFKVVCVSLLVIALVSTIPADVPLVPFA